MAKSVTLVPPVSCHDSQSADVRLTSAKDFYVSQSTLTGESMPVEKHATCPSPARRALWS